MGGIFKFFSAVVTYPIEPDTKFSFVSYEAQNFFECGAMYTIRVLTGLQKASLLVTKTKFKVLHPTYECNY